MIKASVLLLLIATVGCESDKTLDRDEVKRKAIYQEYNLTYSIPEREVESRVYFKTSTSGDYIKLSRQDYVSFRYRQEVNASTTEMKESTTQVYLGSRIVPTYKLAKNYKLMDGSKVTWNWFDSETNKEVITMATVSYPNINLMDDDYVINTPVGEPLRLELSKPLTKNQSLNVSLYINGKHHTGKTFTASSDKILVIGSSTLQKELLQEDENNPERNLQRGRHDVVLKINHYYSQKINNESKKDGMYKQRVYYPEIDLDIIL